MAVKVAEKSVSGGKASKKLITILLILAILMTLASVAIILSNNSKVITDSDNDNSNVVSPAVESAKVSLIINPNPNTPK